MANQRRMFSQKITNSARFLQMSDGAQALYFHLGMAADDDGVVEAFTVLRLTKAPEDDFRVLIVKEFIKPLNEDLVSYILDWKEHNLLRADRLTPSMYRELLVQVIPEVELVQPKTRADLRLSSGRPADSLREEKRREDNTSVATAPQGYTWEDENARPPKESKAKYPHSKEVFSWFPKPEPSWAINTTELKHAELLWARGEANVKKALVYHHKHKDDEGYGYKVVKPSDLERKWNDIKDYARRNK